MKFNFVLFVLLLLVNNSFAAKSHYEITYEKIKGKAKYEDFDIQRYEENQKKGIRGYISLNNGKNIRQTGPKGDYIDYIKYDKPSLLEEYIEYYSNGKIKKYILSFRNSGFFVSKIEFDQKKNITKHIEYDDKYAFKPYELFELIESRFKEIRLGGKNTKIYRHKHYKKYYQAYQNDKNRLEKFTEYVALNKDDEPDLYSIETENKDNNKTKSQGKRIELTVNAQTGEVMLYGSYRITNKESHLKD